MGFGRLNAYWLSHPDWSVERRFEEDDLSEITEPKTNQSETKQDIQSGEKTFFLLGRAAEHGEGYCVWAKRYDTPEAAAVGAEKSATIIRKPVYIFQAIEVIKPVISVEAVRLE